MGCIVIGGRPQKSALCCREMSTGAAIAVAVSVASDVCGRVDERGYLELVPVPIRDIREGLGKVDMLAAADIDRGGGLSAEFMRVSICIIGGKLDLMNMRFAFSNCLTGNCGKSVVVTFVAVASNERASDYLMHMLRVEAFGGKAVVQFFHSDSCLSAGADVPFRE